jgi:hypothetical protein
MPQPTTRLHLPQPCAESWAAMTPTAAGRHCAACQKTVVDFTHKTDAEILATLRQAAGETCGRLRADQLGRPLVAPAPARRWHAWLGAALALSGVLALSRAAAQGQRASYYAGPRPVAGPVERAATAAPGAPGPASFAISDAAAMGPLLVRGVVLDSATHEGLPGVTVLVKGTAIGVSTDAGGAFELSVPAGGAAGPGVLTFGAVGFISQERTIGASQPLTVALAADVKGMMGEVIVVGGIEYKPWPWHPRRFFNWSRFWLTKPFRD